MPLSRRRLLIIHHADEWRLKPEFRLTHSMIPFWREAGIEVTEVHGFHQTPPADVALLHIDLSVVPPPYLKLAQSYPVTINGTVSDIRKSRLSLLRVTPDSNYTGPVIVKSDLNCAGYGETNYFGFQPRLRRLFSRKALRPRYPVPMESKSDYQIYATPTEVPAAVWKSPHLIVETFQPERHGDQYCLREWFFLGDRSYQTVELSPDPISTSGETVHHLDQPLPSAFPALREKLGFNYGKFDYTLSEISSLPFDFNKTPGLVNPHSANALTLAQHLAPGIASFFR